MEGKKQMKSEAVWSLALVDTGAVW